MRIDPSLLVGEIGSYNKRGAGHTGERERIK
jgi:hypothetical protein